MVRAAPLRCPAASPLPWGRGNVEAAKGKRESFALGLCEGLFPGPTGRRTPLTQAVGERVERGYLPGREAARRDLFEPEILTHVLDVYADIPVTGESEEDQTVRVGRAEANPGCRRQGEVSHTDCSRSRGCRDADTGNTPGGLAAPLGRRRTASGHPRRGNRLPSVVRRLPGSSTRCPGGRKRTPRLRATRGLRRVQRQRGRWWPPRAVAFTSLG